MTSIARIRALPQVSSVSDERPFDGGVFVYLAKGWEWSEQTGFGCDTIAEAWGLANDATRVEPTLDDAVRATEIAAKEADAIRVRWSKSADKSVFYTDTPEYRAVEARATQTVGRVTVTANVGGNSRRRHVRHTFKLDGKRTTREAAYAVEA